MSRIKKIIDDIFIQGFQQINVGSRLFTLSPFNGERENRKIQRAVQEEFNKRFSYCLDELGELENLSSSLTQSGFTRNNYQEHASQINAIARDLYGLRWWGSGLYHRCQREDQDSLELSPKFKSIDDGLYGELANRSSTHNIIGESEEGTRFVREYDSQGNLTTYRIFHQGHRNSLQVVTVDLEKLQSKISHLVEEGKKGRINTKVDFPYDLDTLAIEIIPEFNELAKGEVRLNVFNYFDDFRPPSLMAEYLMPHQEVAETYALNLPDEPHEKIANSDKTSLWVNKFPLYFCERAMYDRSFDESLKSDTTPNEVKSYLLIRDINAHYVAKALLNQFS